jgi:hypothetical protein
MQQPPSSEYHSKMSELSKQLAEMGSALSKVDPANFASPTAFLRDITRPISLAESTYNRLGAYIKRFESNLDPDHEIGARLVSFGNTIQFHIESVGYRGPDIISFEGVNEQGERVQLIQNISQLSVLLVAMKKAGEKARRIGFIWDEPSPNP